MKLNNDFKQQSREFLDRVLWNRLDRRLSQVRAFIEFEEKHATLLPHFFGIFGILAGLSEMARSSEPFGLPVFVVELGFVLWIYSHDPEGRAKMIETIRPKAKTAALKIESGLIWMGGKIGAILPPFYTFEKWFDRFMNAAVVATGLFVTYEAFRSLLPVVAYMQTTATRGDIVTNTWIASVLITGPVWAYIIHRFNYLRLRRFGIWSGIYALGLLGLLFYLHTVVA